MMKGKKKTHKKVKFAEMFQMPKDVVLGESIITLIGKREALIENYKGIVEYTNDFLRVRTNQGVIEFRGNGFVITYLTDEEIKITGAIIEIHY